jgi:lipopolysaccharide export system permease protein
MQFNPQGKVESPLHVKKPWYDIGYQIDRLLISSFIPPFLGSFFMALFVLIMQFLWKFIEDIIGKGVGALVIMEMFFYKSVSLFPLALPIAVLLAGVMVMGNLAERYELSSLKSAGVPLTRILAPLVGLSTLIGFFSFYCSNTIIPIANLKYQSRLYDIRNQKPTLSIEPGVFNEDFLGYAIRVGKKHKDKVTIEDIMVYDDSQRAKGKLNVVTAQKGKMYVAEEDGAFVMTLYDGYQYAEADAQGRPNSLPFMISHFKEWTRRFDLGEFDLDRTEEEQFKSHHTMKSARQIATEIDTMNEQIMIARNANNVRYMILNDTLMGTIPIYDGAPQDSDKLTVLEKKLKGKRMVVDNVHADKRYAQLKLALDTLKVGTSPSLTQLLPANLQQEYKGQVNSKISISRSTLDRNARTVERLELSKRKHIYELHWKFSLAAACIFMLLIGGPMGTIVRKGGFGYPLLVSIFFFTFFLMSNISCKKLNDAQKLPPVLAAWLPVILLMIISMILTYKALQDAKIMDTDRMKVFFSKLRFRKKVQPA